MGYRGSRDGGHKACSNHRPAEGWGRGRTLKKLQQISKARRARDPRDPVLPGSGSHSPQGASAGTQRTDPDWSGHDALGDPSDWYLLRRLLGDALRNAAATHTRICCFGPLKVVENLCLPAAQPALGDWGAVRVRGLEVWEAPG